MKLSPFLIVSFCWVFIASLLFAAKLELRSHRAFSSCISSAVSAYEDGVRWKNHKEDVLNCNSDLLAALERCNALLP